MAESSMSGCQCLLLSDIAYKLLQHLHTQLWVRGTLYKMNYSTKEVYIGRNILLNQPTVVILSRSLVFTINRKNAHKTEYMCYNQTGDISTLDGTPLKLVDKFTYLGSSVASTEKDIYTRLTKAWTAINRLSIIWKSDLTDKIKRSFFQAAVTSILLYGCTTWTLTKRLEKKLDGNYCE